MSVRYCGHEVPVGRACGECWPPNRTYTRAEVEAAVAEALTKALNAMDKDIEQGDQYGSLEAPCPYRADHKKHILAIDALSALERAKGEARAEAYERCASNVAGHPHFAGVFLEWAAAARSGKQ